MSGSPTVLVLGSGVIGLTAAITLQQAGYTVDIWAKDLPPYTTSNKAAAYWFPFHVYPPHRVSKWATDTLAYYREHMLPDPRTGVIAARYLHVSMKDKDERPEGLGSVDMWPAKPADLPAHYRSGSLMDTVVANTETAMAYLVRKFQSQGGRLTQRAVKDIEEAFAWYSIVVNCTGLGARELFNDKTVFAARGQVVIVRGKEQWTHIINNRESEKPVYFVPRQMDIVLGGTFQEGNESLLISEEDTRDILRRIEEMVGPAAARDKLDILAERVGLRPCRPEVRLEKELFHGGTKLVVHNYGHGGGGWSLCWGCAAEVLELVKSHQVAQSRARL